MFLKTINIKNNYSMIQICKMYFLFILVLKKIHNKLSLQVYFNCNKKDNNVHPKYPSKSIPQHLKRNKSR